MLYALPHRPDFAGQVGQVLRIADEVDFGAVDHQQGRLVIIKEKVPVSLRDFFDVIRRNAPFVLPIALAQPLEQDIGTGLQIHHQVRFWQARVEQLVELTIQGNFVAVQVHLGENLVLGEEVIDDHAVIEQVLLCQLVLLAIAAEEKEQLGLKGRGVRVFIEALQEGIVFDVLDDGAGAELLGEEPGQARLADTDRPFDDDVTGFHRRNRPRGGFPNTGPVPRQRCGGARLP
jgi:hypothetical protein